MRLVAGFLFFEHGGQKLFGWFGADHTVPIKSLMGLAGALEFLGGILIVLGLFTRPVAFLLSGEMAVAYFKAHAPHGIWPVANKGELAVLYCFVFLYLCIAGAGPFSLDAIFHRKIGRGGGTPSKSAK